MKTIYNKKYLKTDKYLRLMDTMTGWHVFNETF